MSYAHDRRVVIYPSYINKKLKISEGRRIAVEKACEEPTAIEIFDSVTKALHLQAELEHEKCYSRDFWVVGRVRVQLKKDDGSLVNPDIPSRKVLFEKVAEWVPKHPNRSGKARAQAAAKLQASGSGSSAGGGGGGGGGGKSGKKGKKGKNVDRGEADSPCLTCVVTEVTQEDFLRLVVQQGVISTCYGQDLAVFRDIVPERIGLAGLREGQCKAMAGKPASISSFRRAWLQFFPHVKIPKAKRFTKCNVCATLLNDHRFNADGKK
eukprot:jgi/Tetstr1/422942/TSEL_013721.t1